MMWIMSLIKKKIKKTEIRIYIWVVKRTKLDFAG